MTAPLTLDSLVELLDQYSDVYPRSVTGARGWVRARREMPKVDPEVYIEWAKDHWRYHDELDGWTYEHHFRLVDDSVPEIDAGPDMHQILERAHQQLDQERCSHCGDFHDGQEAYLDGIQDAQDAALSADAYFTVVLSTRTDGDVTYYEPVIFAEALSATARTMLEAQLVHVASQVLEAHMLDQINKIERGPE